MDSIVKKILLINYEFPPIGGGAGTASLETSRALVRIGFNVTVVTSRFTGLPRKETVDGVDIRRIRALRKNAATSSPLEMLSFVISGFFHLPRLLKEIKPDCCICYFSIPSGILGLFCGCFYGIPYIVSLRGGDVPGFPLGALGIYHKFTIPLTRTIWKNAVTVTTNSQNLKTKALPTMPGLDIPIIPNGVDIHRFSPPERDVDPQHFVKALFVGRLNSQKGIHFLLRALATVKSSLKGRFRLVIVGGGSEERKLRSLASELQLSEFIDFRGWITPSNIPEIYREADFFVFPSLEEGMPNAVLEAMSSALPVIIIDTPGCTPLVENGVNGFVIPINNLGEPDLKPLAEAVVTMISDDATRARMGLKSREKAASFSWDETARLFAEIIQKNVSSNAP